MVRCEDAVTCGARMARRLRADFAHIKYRLRAGCVQIPCRLRCGLRRGSLVEKGVVSFRARVRVRVRARVRARVWARVRVGTHSSRKES